MRNRGSLSSSMRRTESPGRLDSACSSLLVCIRTSYLHFNSRNDGDKQRNPEILRYLLEKRFSTRCRTVWQQGLSVSGGRMTIVSEGVALHQSSTSCCSASRAPLSEPASEAGGELASTERTLGAVAAADFEVSVHSHCQICLCGPGHIALGERWCGRPVIHRKESYCLRGDSTWSRKSCELLVGARYSVPMTEAACLTLPGSNQPSLYLGGGDGSSVQYIEPEPRRQRQSKTVEARQL